MTLKCTIHGVFHNVDSDKCGCHVRYAFLTFAYAIHFTIVTSLAWFRRIHARWNWKKNKTNSLSNPSGSLCHSVTLCTTLCPIHIGNNNEMTYGQSCARCVRVFLWPVLLDLGQLRTGEYQLKTRRNPVTSFCGVRKPDSPRKWYTYRKVKTTGFFLSHDSLSLLLETRT